VISEVIDNEQVELLLNDVLETHGYDFLEYSHASIKRRITRLYALDSFVSFAEFRYTVRTDKQYFKRFLEEITVNVTEMFRDPSFYKALRNDVLPVLGTYPFIRIWVAGCSTGEEAYSLAILLKELNLLNKSLIYATDINPSVLEKAKKGAFPIHKMQAYTKNYLLAGGNAAFSEYYKTDYQYAYFHPSLLKNIIFAQHNLVTDQSFNEFHIILCRNVLIYFSQALQSKVHHLFYESLSVKGFLCLGDKETLRFDDIMEKYKKIVGNERIYQKVN